jgi:hypothetical protein
VTGCKLTAADLSRMTHLRERGWADKRIAESFGIHPKSIVYHLGKPGPRPPRPATDAELRHEPMANLSGDDLTRAFERSYLTQQMYDAECRRRFEVGQMQVGEAA